MYQYSLGELAEKIGARLIGSPSIKINSIGSVTKANEAQVSFVVDKKNAMQLTNCMASAVILKEEFLIYWSKPALIVNDPYLAYAKLAKLFDNTPKPTSNISVNSTIAPDAIVGKNVSIGDYSVIDAGVIIGDNVSIGSGCYIGKGSKIGAGCSILPNVTIYHRVTIGQQSVIHAGCVIGSDGFGYANENGKWIKIPQLGSVIISNNVEIGASTTIDRGALDDTIIGNGVVIDNQCQIAHNVEIGDYTAIAGCTCIAGSTSVGKYCRIGGAAVINGHITICDNVVITGMGMVMRSIESPGIYSSGIPLQKNKDWRKTASHTLQIDKMNNRIKALEKNKQ